MRWHRSKNTFWLRKPQRTPGATAITNHGFEHSELGPQVIRIIYEPNCDEKNGDYFMPGKGSIVEMDVQHKYSKPRQPHWLLRRIFILTWIGAYDRERAFADLIAGITLGLTIIPQSIAYAALANLSSEYGLYSAFIGSIIYVFFGTIPQVSIGPTSLMALLTMQYCTGKPVQVVIVLAFLAGLIELLMGVFQLGFIVSFIPVPVTQAFTSGTAVIVVLVQVKNLLGIKLRDSASFGDYLSSIRAGDAIMGTTCLIILLSLRLLSQVKFKQDTPLTRRLKKLLWYISISRNALVVFFCGLLVFVWVGKSSFEAIPFALSSKVSSAMPRMQLPPFAFEANNRTYVFTDIINELGSGIIVVPIVAVLANVAIAKAFVKDGNLDASQEMLTLGLCNLAGSFFSAMPTCGAFTRSAVSQASGVRTPMAGIYTGLIVLSALSILTPYFQYIPKSSLSAVLISAVIFMIDFKPITQLWSTNKKDFFCWLGCFLICLLSGVELGLLFGIVLSMIFILLRLGNPKIDVRLQQYGDYHFIHIVPKSDVYFTGVDCIRNEVRKACALYRHDFPIVLDCARFMQFDATFVEMLNAVARELNESYVLLQLSNLNEKWRELLPVVGNLRISNDLAELFNEAITNGPQKSSAK